MPSMEWLLENTENLSLALEAGQLGSFLLDLTTRSMHCNPQCKANFGLPTDTEITFDVLIAMIYAEDRPQVQESVERALRNHADYEAEYRIHTPNGGTRWIASRGRAVYDTTGKPTQIIGVTQDVSAPRAAQEAVRRSEARYRQLLETAREGILFLDATGHISHVNLQFTRMMGYDRAEEVIGQEVFFLFFPEEAWRAREKWEARLAGVQENYELRLRARDNSERWFIAHVTVERDEDTGAFQGTFTLLTDITERRRVERELTAKNEEIATVFDRVTDAFAAFDTDWNFVYLNSGAEHILGKSRDALIGRCLWEEFEGARDTLVYTEYLRSQREQVPVAFEVYYGALLGWFEVRAYPSPSGLSAYFRDISERKQAEQDRERAIEERARFVAELQEAGIRQRRFLKEMLAGFTEGRLRLCFLPDELPVPLQPLSESLELSEPALRRLRKKLEAVGEGLKLPKERLQEFETAVHEAAMNAVKYGGGGTARIHGDTATGEIQAWIRDDGPGIAEELIHRALERGYTTGGFGHGMFFMQSCTDRLYLFSETGKGTTIVLEMDRTLPEPAWLHSGN